MANASSLRSDAQYSNGKNRQQPDALSFRAQFEALVQSLEREIDYASFGLNAERRVVFSVANHRGSQEWFTVSTKWAVLLTLLTAGIVTKVKDSIMICPGALSGGTTPGGTRKLKSNVEALYLAVLDFDKGDAPLPVLEARLAELNLESAMYSTFSNGKDKTELAWSIKRPNSKTGSSELLPSAFQLYVRKRLGTDAPEPEQITGLIAKSFMVEELDFGSEVLGEVSIVATDKIEKTTTSNNDKQLEVVTHSIVVGHNPIAKTRLVIPLAAPIMRQPDESNEAFQKRWTDEVYAPLGRLIGCKFDKACASTERGHYAMTVKEGAKEEPVRWVQGDLLDLDTPSISEAFARHRTADSEKDSNHESYRQDRSKDTYKSARAQPFSDQWLGFKAADAAADLLVSVTDKRSDKDNPLVAFPCPFVHEHATSNDPSAHQCYAYNAKSAEKMPTVKCQSDTCQDRPYVEFLDALFDDKAKGDQKYRAAPKAPRTGVFIHSDELEDKLHEINENWAVVRLGNKTRFLHQTQDGAIELYDLKSLTAWFSNWFYFWHSKAGTLEKAPILPAWLSWQYRRQYRGMRFSPEPGGTPDGIFNTYFGFTVEPQKGSWKRLLGHIYRNICRRNPEYFKFTIAWLAQLVQQPHIKPGTNIVLKGSEGVGKSKLGEWIIRLFGHNAIAVSESNRITGQFNGHLENKLFMLGEEAFWAGDKAAEGKLKDLATGTVTSYERKGLDAYEGKNYTRLMITSNEDWVVPASSGGRRWFVLEVSDEQKQNHKYFSAIDEEMAGGGLSAMLYDLLQSSLPNKVNVRNAPVTPWLVEQRLHSYDNRKRWWRGVLQEGGFRDNATNSFVELYEDRPTVVKREDIFSSAKRYFAGPKGVDPTPSEIGQFLTKILGKLGEARPRSEGRRHWCTIFPPLRELRQLWFEQTGEKIGSLSAEDLHREARHTEHDAQEGEKHDLGTNPFANHFEDEAIGNAVHEAWEAGVTDLEELANVASFETEASRTTKSPSSMHH